MLKSKQILLRIGIALGVGVAISCISLYVAWQNACAAPLARYEQYTTQSKLKEAAEAMKKYHEQHGVFPGSVAELESMTNEFSFPEGTELLDGWKRQLIFSFDGTNCLLTSYGRDGKLGGEGLDCDLTSKDWKPKASRPTFEQFFHDMPVRGMINSSWICGILTGFLALLTVKVPQLDRKGFGLLAVRIVAIIIGAAFVTSIIVGLHIPSGH